MPNVSFVILQPTPFCNIACKYCYLPDRASTGRMTLETIHRFFSELFSLGWAAKDLYVIWHAGEPLVLPVDYYEKAFTCIAELTPEGVELRHGIQTNGILIDEDWCRLFRAHRVAVGVSIDGPEDLHDANRITRSGKPTFADALAGLRCLRRNDVEFGVITVLTDKSLDRARDLFEFYKQEGIKSVCFNIEEIEGCNLASSLSAKGKQQAYEDFLREFWNLNVAADAITYIREFKHMLQKIVQPSDNFRIDNTMIEPFEHLNVDWQGRFSTFSPELLGQRNDRYDDFIIGDVWQTGLAGSVQSERLHRLRSDIAAGVALCSASCSYFPVCGGGDPVNKLYENRTFASTETMYCRMHVKAVANVCMEIVDSTSRLQIEREAGPLAR